MFKFNQDSRIYLYGAATIGKIIYNNLEKKGYKVEKFIDKRAGEIKTFMHLPVIDIECLDEKDKNDIIVIVSVKNVFEHKKIVEDFIGRGFYQLIYMPEGILNGKPSQNEHVIESIYQKLLSGEMGLECLVPKTKRIEETYEIIDHAIIETREKTYIVQVPWQLIFSNKKADDKQVWGGINCIQLFPHIELFKAFSGDVCADISDYIDFCYNAAKDIGDIKTTEAWKRNVIKNRYDVYCNMENMLQFDTDFFVRSAPFAEWNDENKVFYLKSGKHRTTFLLSKNYNFIPIEILKSDYELWRKSYCCRSDKQDRKEDYEQLHPYMIRYPFEYKQYYNEVQKSILGYLSKKIYEKENSVDLRNVCVLYDRNVAGDGFIKVLKNCRVDVKILQEKQDEFFECDYCIMEDNRLNNAKIEKYEIKRGAFLSCVEKHEVKTNSEAIRRELLSKGVYDAEIRYLYFVESEKK